MRRFLLLLALLPALAKPAASQLPSLTASPTPTPETAAGDPFHRETPRSSLLGFISAAQKGDWPLATEFLQASGSAGEAAREALAKEFEAVLNRAFTGDIQKLSDAPLGDLGDGLPPELERAGRIVVGDASVDLLLVRKTPPEGPPVWLVSSQTLREIPRLSRELGTPKLEEKLPEALRRPLGLLPAWQLLAFLGLLPLLYVLARVVLSMAAKPLRARLEKSGRHGHLREALARARTPLAVLLTLLLHRLAVPWLSLSLLFRYRYGLWSSVAVVAASAWLFLRLIDSLSGAAHDRFAAAGSTAVPVITLGRGILKGFVWVVAALAALSVFGVNLTAVLAGLGIGGVALAFAAKTSIENIFGGFTVLGTKSLRVGDFCRIGGYLGTIEDITLFATRLRTLERVVVSIPNGALLTKEIENLSRRDRFLFRHTLGLRYETTLVQLRAVLDATRKLLTDDQRIAPGSTSVRFVRLGDSALSIELFAYVQAADWSGFLAVQEELLLALLDLVAAAGTGLAFPSQTLYLGRDAPPSPPAGPSVPPGG